MKKAAIYARVSTIDQVAHNQVMDLQAIADKNKWQVVATLIDNGISGAKGADKRPAYKQLYDGIINKEFDVVLAWSIDRLSRSNQELLNFRATLDKHNADVFILKQNLDTTTPGGRAMFGMFAVFAEFERDIITERIKTGMQRAKKEGRVISRPDKSHLVADNIINLYRGTNWGMVKIARHMGIGTKVVQKIVKKFELYKERPVYSGREWMVG
jgi:DNA invertase Pin-like site-specific DNA recombinase